jgi:hypothetical protein
VPWPEPLTVPPPWEGGDGNAINEPRRRDRSAGGSPAPEARDGRERRDRREEAAKP